MEFNDVREAIAGVPYTTPERGKILYDFVRSQRRVDCLELGHAHGVSTCYIAAALQANGEGHLTSVDLLSAESLQPSAEELLRSCGIGHRVTLVREHSSYNWFLKKEIEARSTRGFCEPRFDFAFVDGAKNWTTDGFAFFLVDKLLTENAWLVFDDLHWTYDAHERLGHTSTDGIVFSDLAADERHEAHVEAIFQLLVMQHPSYSHFRIQDDAWAWAHKLKADPRNLVIEESAPLAVSIARTLRNTLRKVRERQYRR